MSTLFTAKSSQSSKNDETDHQLVTVSFTAQKEVRRLLAEEPEGHGLRLGIKGGGCSGLTYVTEFTELRDGDTIIDLEGFRVFLDRKSTIYLGGITLDFQDGLTGKGFIFVNPHATNTCGCGESFSL